MCQKDKRRNTGGAKAEKKNEIKIGKGFWPAENWNFDSNNFYLKIL
jgi:hypothetical protein